MALNKVERASLRKVSNRQSINKRASADSVARTTINRKRKRRSLMDGLKARIGARLIGKSQVTGEY